MPLPIDKNKVIVFDFDGTLVNTFEVLLLVINQLSDEYKFGKIAPEEFDTLKNLSWPAIRKHVGIPLLKVPFIFGTAQKNMFKDIELLKPVAGMPEVLHELNQQGYRLGILTSHPTKNINRFLERYELTQFDFVSSIFSLWGKKSRLKNMLNQHRLSSSGVLYIGDETRDVEAARQNAIQVAAVTWGYNAVEVLKASHPDFIVQTPEELLDLIVGCS